MQKVVGSCEIIHLGESSVKIGGLGKIFEVLFKNKHEEKLTEIHPVWMLDFSMYPELSSRVQIIEELGSSIVIKAIDSNLLLNKSFNLQVSGESEEYGYFENCVEIKLIG